MNFWTLLSLGSVIQTHGSARHGRRAKDWRTSLRIVEPYWFWMVWSPSKIRMVHKKDVYVSPPSRRFCVSSLHSIPDFACLPRGCRLLISQITSIPQPRVVILEHLSSDAGAKLLRAMGVKGDEAELQSASLEFDGHCLALTLLGSYLADAYNGDIRCRKEVSARLAHDMRQGLHARKVMESYQTWFGEGPELSVLRMLGLFDRPADEKVLGALLKPPAIPGLTESLVDLSPSEWRTILARLRRARLLAGEDPHNPGHLDTHPLVREYFGEQLRSHQAEAWKECNRRLYQSLSSARTAAAG